VPSAKEMAPIAFEKYKKGQFENVAYFEPYYLKDFVIQSKKKV
jgi:tRNA threonylcarbamoyladenosine biosynthesis protein TsaB